MERFSSVVDEGQSLHSGVTVHMVGTGHGVSVPNLVLNFAPGPCRPGTQAGTHAHQSHPASSIISNPAYSLTNERRISFCLRSRTETAFVRVWNKHGPESSYSQHPDSTLRNSSREKKLC